MPYDDELDRAFSKSEAEELLNPPCCAHCKSDANIEELGHRSTVRMEHWDHWQKDTFGCESHVFYCKSCDDITAFRVVHNYSNKHHSILYPRQYNLDVPAPQSVIAACGDVERGFASAPRDCALAVRRLLEAICEDRGLSGGVLAQNLNRLAADGILPQKAVDLCHLLRKIGNMGAHHGEAGDRISTQDARILYASIRLILESLYGVDVVIDRLKRRIASDMEDQTNDPNQAT